MPRKSVTQKILEELSDWEDEESSYILVYTFNPNERIPTHFYLNLKKLLESLLDGIMLQRSVVLCNRSKTLEAMKMLADHYGAETRLFKVDEEFKKE